MLVVEVEKEKDMSDSKTAGEIKREKMARDAYLETEDGMLREGRITGIRTRAHGSGCSTMRPGMRRRAWLRCWPQVTTEIENEVTP